MHDRHSFLAFRRLLTRVRDVMAAGAPAAQQLGDIAIVVAAEMQAEVCSVYVRRAGDVLELFATEGLLPTAVHRTRLRVGEGLIGVIAASTQPLAVADAHRHPDFVYRPETGEEIYQSLCGVPIVGRGRVVGVLAVQSRERRHFGAPEIELLQTIAMLLAALIRDGNLIGRDELAPIEGEPFRTVRLEGIALNAGLACGTACLHRPRPAVRHFVADDTRLEHERLRMAVAAMHDSLDAALSRLTHARERESRDVLESYRMISADGGWLGRIGEAIDTGLTAEASVQKVANDLRARFRAVADPYLRERADDFEDLANRLLRHLFIDDDTVTPIPKSDDMIIVAQRLGPADLLTYDRERLRGVVLEEGSPTSHVTIVARALDIPALGQTRAALARIDHGDTIIVDADHGQAFVRPGEEIRRSCRHSLAANAARRAAYAATQALPAVSRDGVAVGITVNAGLSLDMKAFADYGAEGVGLFRTEVAFLLQRDFPDVDRQTDFYRRVLDYADGAPVTFRTLDLGGDKSAPFAPAADDENPAMGWRGIRVCLDRPAILRGQLRALIRAATGRELRVMFPMVASVDEFLAAKTLLDLERSREAAAGRTMPGAIRVGVMLEVPSLLFELPRLLRHVDFVSVGTNDFVQFLFAADRGHGLIAQRYDPLSPVVLTVLNDVLQQCRAAAVPIALCGEMASSTLDAMALIGLGFRTLSVAPPAVGPVKAMIRSVALAPLREFVFSLLDRGRTNVRENLGAYARDHGIAV